MSLTWNERGGYYEGNADAARWDAEERRMAEEEREWEALKRAARLLHLASEEMADEGRSRRFHSLKLRAKSLIELV